MRAEQNKKNRKTFLPGWYFTLFFKIDEFCRQLKPIREMQRKMAAR